MSFVGVLLMWSAMQHPQVTAAARAQQPTGYAHAWGKSFGTVFNDEGRGIAVTNDGSVIHTSTSLNYTDESQNFPMAHVRKIVGGADCWSLTYAVGAVGVDWVATRALALADASTEQSLASSNPATAYIAGLYRGEVSFGAQAPAPTNDSTFVARIRETNSACPQGSAETSWVLAFTPTSTQEEDRNSALAIATARQARHCADDLHSAPRTDVHGKIVVCGFFKGETTFANGPTLTPTGEDAYIALVAPSGVVQRVLVIGGQGNQRITAVAIDERTQDLIVAGWYDHAGTDFDPGSGVSNRTLAGGKDLFAARIHVPRTPPEEPLSNPELKWLHTFGTSGEDEAACVALGVNDDTNLTTLAFVGGWTSGAGAGRDLYVAAIKDDGSPRWFFNPAASGDDRVLGVTVDGLGRPVFTGQFGCPYIPNPNTSCADPSIQFGSALLSPSGLDVFVARFHPITSNVDWAYKLGGNLDESATAIAFDPAYTGSFALTGWFGRPDAAPGLYSINLDPAGLDPPVTGAGFADAFVSLLAPTAPEYVGFQASLLISNGCTMTKGRTANQTEYNNFTELMKILPVALPDQNVLPWRGETNPGGGSRYWSVQVNALLSTTAMHRGRRAKQVMPWTVLDDKTAPLFARKLAATPPQYDGGLTAGEDLPWEGLRAAADSLGGAGVEAFASLLYIADQLPESPSLPDARDYAALRFERLCVVGSNSALRSEMLSNVVAPTFSGGPEAIDRNSSGFAGAAEDMRASGPFNSLLTRALTRLGWCVSDYNRNEQHDVFDEPNLRTGAAGAVPYADWNFDGVFDAHIPSGIDWDKLALNLSRPCP